MSLVVDASVFVAGSRTVEEQYAASEEFLSLATLRDESIHCPSIVLPECAAAIMRATGDPSVARETVQQIRRAVRPELVPLNIPSAEQAVEITVQCRTRGADSCYVALAVALGAVLITWDREMLERGSSIVKTMTPPQWIQAQAEKESR